MALGKKKNKKAAKPPVQVGRFTRLRFRLWLFMLCLVFMTYLPLAVTVLVGMAPTVVQFLIERERRKFKAQTVGYINFVACLYVVAPGFSKGPLQPLSDAWMLVLDPMNLLIMYSGAALGLVANIVLPSMASVYIARRQTKEKKMLMKERTRLLRYWGEGVGRLSTQLLTDQQLQTQNKSKQRAMQRLFSALRVQLDDDDDLKSYYDKNLASFEQRYGDIDDHLGNDALGDGKNGTDLSGTDSSGEYPDIADASDDGIIDNDDTNKVNV